MHNKELQTIMKMNNWQISDVENITGYAQKSIVRVLNGSRSISKIMEKSIRNANHAHRETECGVELLQNSANSILTLNCRVISQNDMIIAQRRLILNYQSYFGTIKRSLLFITLMSLLTIIFAILALVTGG